MEYGLADMIYTLSNNPSSPFPGWCFMSRPTMAQEMGVSRRTIINYLDKLEDLDLIEKNPDTSYVKTTLRWYNEVMIRDKESDETGGEKNARGGEKVASKGVQKLHGGGAKSSPYKDINKNSKNTTLSPVENSKKSDHRNPDGTLDVNGFLHSIKSESKPKEAPPVAPPPPEMDEFEMQDEAVRILTQKATLSRERYEIQHMKAKHKRTFEEMQEEAGRFAEWYIANMIESDEADFKKILAKIKALTRAQAQTIYTAKFWNRKYGLPQNRNQNGTATHKKKSSRLTDEGFRERWGDLVDQLNANEGITVPNGDNAGTVDEIESLPVTDWIEVGSSVFG